MQKLQKLKSGFAKKLAVFTILLSVIFCSGMSVTKVMASPSGESGNLESLSFASMTEAAATYLSSSLSPSGAGAALLPSAGNESVDWTNAGGLAGYSESEEGFGDWLLSHITMASQNASYSTYLSMSRDLSSQSDTTNAMYYYANYGRLLNIMGFDAVGYQGTAAMRRISGFFLMIAYAVSGIVPAMFAGVIGLLKILNPFQLFSISGFNDIIAGVVNADSSALAPLARAIQPTLNELSKLGLVLFMPLYLVGLITEIYLFKKTKTSSAIKKFTLRLCSIMLALPLLGATYTEILSAMDDTINTASSASTETIYSILLDFKSWAEKGNLQLPNGYSIGIENANSVSKPHVSSATVLNSRSLCLKLNSVYSNPSLSAITQESGLNGALNFNTNLYKSGSRPTENAYTSTLGLITSYMAGEKYKASDFEAAVKASVNNLGNNRADISKIGELFTSTNEYKDWQALATNTGNIGDLPLSASDLLLSPTGGSGGGIVANVWGNGDSNMVASGNASAITYTSNASHEFEEGIKLGVMLGDNDYGGLSTVSMYNYLNTSFDPNSLTVYSSDATSDYTRQSHYNTNLIGSGGVQPFAYWLNAMSLMICFIVIGIGYALAMIGTVISRSVRLIMAVPMMLLGSIKAMGQAIVYSLVMITQVLATILMYDIMTKLVLSANGILTIPIAEKINMTSTIMDSGVTSASFSAISYPWLLMLGSLFQFLFIFVALKERKKLVKGLEEASERVIDNLLGTKAGADTGASLGEKGLKAGAAGLGMAAAANYASKHGQLKDDDQDDSMPNTKNPDKDDAAGMSDNPSATGGGGDNSSGGIEGEDRAMIAEQQKGIEGTNQKLLEDKSKDIDKNKDTNPVDESDENVIHADDDADNDNNIMDRNDTLDDDSNVNIDHSDNSKLAVDHDGENRSLSDDELASKAIAAGSLAATMKQDDKSAELSSANTRDAVTDSDKSVVETDKESTDISAKDAVSDVRGAKAMVTTETNSVGKQESGKQNSKETLADKSGDMKTVGDDTSSVKDTNVKGLQAAENGQISPSRKTDTKQTFATQGNVSAKRNELNQAQQNHAQALRDGQSSDTIAAIPSDVKSAAMSVDSVSNVKSVSGQNNPVGKDNISAQVSSSGTRPSTQGISAKSDSELSSASQESSVDAQSQVSSQSVPSARTAAASHASQSGDSTAVIEQKQAALQKARSQNNQAKREAQQKLNQKTAIKSALVGAAVSGVLSGGDSKVMSMAAGVGYMQANQTGNNRMSDLQSRETEQQQTMAKQEQALAAKRQESKQESVTQRLLNSNQAIVDSNNRIASHIGVAIPSSQSVPFAPQQRVGGVTRNNFGGGNGIAMSSSNQSFPDNSEEIRAMDAEIQRLNVSTQKLKAGKNITVKHSKRTGKSIKKDDKPSGVITS